MVQSTSRGLKLELHARKNSYAAGELPEFTAVITNQSGQGILFCTYLQKHRLLISLMGNGYEVFPFTKTPNEPLRNSDFRTLAPGESITVPLNIKAEDGYNFLYAGHLPPLVTQDFALKGFPKGTYVFKIFLGTHVSFFDAPEGTYNHSRKRKHMLTELTAENLSVDPKNAWDGEMEATTSVTFS